MQSVESIVSEIKSVLESFYRELDHNALYRGDWRAFTESFAKAAEKYRDTLYKIKYGTTQPLYLYWSISRRAARELGENPELARFIRDFEDFVSYVSSAINLRDKPLFAFYPAVNGYLILTSIVGPKTHPEVVKLIDKYGKHREIAYRYFRNVGESRLTDKHHEEALRELHEEEKRLEEVRLRTPARIHVEEENWMQILRPVKGSRRKVKA